MDNDARLSRIETLWSVVQRAHDDDLSAARVAQQQLMNQYGGAVRRYLLAALRDEDAADEVFQEFSLRFVRGDFQKASPERGRFRSFVKTAVYHLIVDYHRRSQRNRKNQSPACEFSWDPQQSLAQLDAEFTSSWRNELLASSWAALQEQETKSGKPYYTVLRFRADHPELRSPELAAELSKKLDKQLTAGNVRVIVHRARELFAELLVAQVEASLKDSTLDELEDELIALDLLTYCKPTLSRRRGNGNS